MGEPLGVFYNQIMENEDENDDTIPDVYEVGQNWKPLRKLNKKRSKNSTKGSCKPSGSEFMRRFNDKDDDHKPRRSYTTPHYMAGCHFQHE